MQPLAAAKILPPAHFLEYRAIRREAPVCRHGRLRGRTDTAGLAVLATSDVAWAWEELIACRARDGCLEATLAAKLHRIAFVGLRRLRSAELSSSTTGRPEPTACVAAMPKLRTARIVRFVCLMKRR